MVRVRVRLGYTMAICLVLQHQVSTKLVRMRSELSKMITCHATCADEVKPVQTRGGTCTVMQLMQTRGGTRTVMQLVQTRGGTYTAMQLVQMRGEILYNIHLLCNLCK